MKKGETTFPDKQRIEVISGKSAENAAAFNFKCLLAAGRFRVGWFGFGVIVNPGVEEQPRSVFIRFVD